MFCDLLFFFKVSMEVKLLTEWYLKARRIFKLNDYPFQIKT